MSRAARERPASQQTRGPGCALALWADSPAPHGGPRSLGAHPQDEVVTVSGQNVGVPHQEHLWGRVQGLTAGDRHRHGRGGGAGARRGHRTHADGHEVRKDDGVPQVVEPAVAEEELGALQERRPVLGPRRALGAGGTRMLRNVGRPAGATGGPTVPAPPILGFGFL